jgi:carboxymethylenebutenolidase
MIKSQIALMACVLFIATTSLAAIPPGEPDAKATLEKSPRHGEYVDVARAGKTALRAYVVYPETRDKAPVVIVIHEIFGLTDWVRSVADQLAADGFIAIAPDLLSGLRKDGAGTDAFASRDDVVKAVRGLSSDEVNAGLDAVREHGTKLPASNGKTATIGFCWGGARSFAYATHQPELSAAVVYYGTSPDRSAIEKVRAPVLGLDGSDDARVNATVAPADAAMKELGKHFEHHTYDGAGHGFLRQQDGRDGANRKAAEQAWKRTIEFLREKTSG